MDLDIIVFLDDDENRAALLHQRMSREDLQRTIWVRNVEEALDLLINYRDRLKYVSLEHDLNGPEYVHPGSDRSGMEIVRWLEKQDSDKYKHVAFIVHTHNPIGMKMTIRLAFKGYRVLFSPFGM